jgi:LEA14-like dessication related protein
MRTYLWIALFPLLLTAGCRVVPPQITGARAFSLTRDDQGNRALRMEIRVNNPNALGFRVDDPVFEVFLNAKKVAAAYNGKPIRVKARSHDYYGIFLSTPLRSWTDFLGPALSIITTGKATFEIKGYLTARFLFWKKMLPVRIKEEISVKDLL